MRLNLNCNLKFKLKKILMKIHFLIFRTSRYTVAALESKVENYEKEIKQLQKALEKRDNYINELEKTKKSPPKILNQPLTPPKQETLSTKSVKFVDNINNEPVKTIKTSKPESTRHRNSNQNIIFTKPTISNDKFYGSPKKSSSSAAASSNHILSFSDRLKKNMSFDLEIPSPNSTLNVTVNNNGSSDNSNSKSSSINELLAVESNTNEFQKELIKGGTENKPFDYLFSPMKRLKLEESELLEKPSFIIDPNDDSIQVAPSIKQLNITVTPEFNDCLQLLNEAETKVQNRVPSNLSKNSLSPHSNSTNETPMSILKTNSNALPDKYFQPSSPRAYTTEAPAFNNQSFKGINNDQFKIQSNLGQNDFYSNSNLFRSRSVDQNIKN
jgi:hypothetical protein